MLEEVEEFVSEIVFGIGDISNKLTSALNRWNNRLQSTQVLYMCLYHHCMVFLCIMYMYCVGGPLYL